MFEEDRYQHFCFRSRAGEGICVLKERRSPLFGTGRSLRDLKRKGWLPAEACYLCKIWINILSQLVLKGIYRNFCGVSMPQTLTCDLFWDTSTTLMKLCCTWSMNARTGIRIPHNDFQRNSGRLEPAICGRYGKCFIWLCLVYIYIQQVLWIFLVGDPILQIWDRIP